MYPKPIKLCVEKRDSKSLEEMKMKLKDDQKNSVAAQWLELAIIDIKRENELQLRSQDSDPQPILLSYNLFLDREGLNPNVVAVATLGKAELMRTRSGGLGKAGNKAIALSLYDEVITKATDQEVKFRAQYGQAAIYAEGGRTVDPDVGKAWNMFNDLNQEKDLPADLATKVQFQISEMRRKSKAYTQNAIAMRQISMSDSTLKKPTAVGTNFSLSKVKTEGKEEVTTNIQIPPKTTTTSVTSNLVLQGIIAKRSATNALDGDSSKKQKSKEPQSQNKSDTLEDLAKVATNTDDTHSLKK